MPPKASPIKVAPQPGKGATAGKGAKDAAQPGAKKGAPAAAAAKPVPKEDDSYLNIDPSLMERTGLNSIQLQELIEIFSLVDVDHGGTIDTDELGVLMNTLGLHPTQMELEAMVKELDSENTGEIDFESFVGAMTRTLETDITHDELAKAFRTFTIYDGFNELVTPEHDGSIPRSMLLNILTNFGDPDKRMTSIEAEELIKSVAPHGSHSIFNYTEFIQMYLPKAIPK
ncbi:hypothetical protein BC830DRAFT_790351 [Chytriomyces sp. MP71]|nr:hypothetical protein BC830DRAFT_790351 [Chytriomyces sp. MP71]